MSNKEKQKYYTISEMHEIVKFMVKTNFNNRKHKLSDRNIALELIGDRGIGKTEFVEGFAKKYKIAFHKINLAQITDETSLLGYPRQTYRMQITLPPDPKDPNSTSKVLTKRVLVNELNDHLTKGYKLISEDSELSYSSPHFISHLQSTEKSILFLDESKRALPHIIQATMDLIQFGKYGNWSLPPGCTIILANNPNDGNYNVSSLDIASNDRMFKYHMKSDIDSWVQWASTNNIKEECINFLYKSPEVRDSLDKPSNRTWTSFFLSINDLNLRNSDDLDMIYNLGVGSIGEENVLIFKTFITNNLDIIPSIKWIFDPNSKLPEVLNKLKECIIDKESRVVRNDIKGLLGIRIKSYLRSPNLDKTVTTRFLEILQSQIVPKESFMDILLDTGAKNHPNPNINKELLSHPIGRQLLMSNNDI